MIFSLQRHLEDYFERRGLTDNDQYAVKVANLYATWRHSTSKNAFLKRMGRVQTVFFRANLSVSRAPFQGELVEALDRRFPQEKARPRRLPTDFPAVWLGSAVVLVALVDSRSSRYSICSARL